MSIRLGLSTASALLLTAAVSIAATATGNLTVTATVANSCSVSTTALDFSLLNTGSSTVEATPGTVSVVCTADQTGTTVTLDGGLNESAGSRRMDDGGTNFIAYSIFTDAGRTSSVASGGTIFSGNLTATTQVDIDLYGEVPSGNYPAGSYSDTVLVTLTY